MVWVASHVLVLMALATVGISQPAMAEGNLSGTLTVLNGCQRNLEPDRVCLALYSSAMAGEIRLRGRTMAGKRVTRVVLTNEDGSFDLPLPAGFYRVAIRKIDALPQTNFAVVGQSKFSLQDRERRYLRIEARSR